MKRPRNLERNGRKTLRSGPKGDFDYLPTYLCVCYGPTGRGTRTGHASVCVCGVYVRMCGAGHAHLSEGMGQAHIPACAPPGHSALRDNQPLQELPRRPHAPVQPSPPPCSLFTPVIHTVLNHRARMAPAAAAHRAPRAARPDRHPAPACRPQSLSPLPAQASRHLQQLQRPLPPKPPPLLRLRCRPCRRAHRPGDSPLTLPRPP